MQTNTNAERQAALSRRGAEIAAEMPGWTYCDREDASQWTRHRLVRGDDGLELQIFVTDDLRLGIRDHLPDYPDGRGFHFSTYSDEHQLTHRITSAYDKAARLIARDILRRLVPNAEIRRRVALDAITSETDRETQRQDAVTRLARLLNVPVRDDWKRRDARPDIGQYSGACVSVNSPTSFTLKVNADSLDQAEALVRAVQTVKPTDIRAA